MQLSRNRSSLAALEAAMSPATPSDGHTNPIFSREGSGSGPGDSDADSNAEAATAAATAVETEGTPSQLVAATATQRQTEILPSATTSAAAGHGPSYSLPDEGATAALAVQPSSSIGTEGDTDTGSFMPMWDLLLCACKDVTSLAIFVHGLASAGFRQLCDRDYIATLHHDMQQDRQGHHRALSILATIPCQS